MWSLCLRAVVVMSGKGMSFLNKKSWHTGGLPMLRKVWAAEEREKQEQRTIEQLRKEKAEERALEDSRRLQAQQGLVTATAVERVEWLYAGQTMSEAVKQEQYLLGAAVKDSKPADSTAVTAAVKAADERWKRGSTEDGHPSGPTSNGRDEAARLREDPLLAILREQQKRTQLPTTHTRPLTVQRSSIAGTEAERAKRRDSDVQSDGRADRRAEREGGDGERRGGRREERKRERDRRERRSSRDSKRARHRSRSRSPSQSESSQDSDRERRRDRRRRRRSSRSRSRGNDFHANPYSQHEDSRHGRLETSHEVRVEAANVRREEAVRAERWRESNHPSSRSGHKQPEAAAADAPRQSSLVYDSASGRSAAASSSAVSSLSVPFVSPSPSSLPVPVVVSSAFVSSTTAFGGRLGLILPRGAPSPLPQPVRAAPTDDKQQYDNEQREREDEARRAAAVTAPSLRFSAVSPQPPLVQARPSPLAALSEAERAERLLAMQSDADSLLDSRRQSAREAAQQQSSSSAQSERSRTVSEADCLSAPLLKALRHAASDDVGGRLNKQQLLSNVDER